MSRTRRERGRTAERGRAAPDRAEPRGIGLEVLALQRSAGNAYVTRMLQRVTITDEDGVELREVSTPELVGMLSPRVQRLLARLPPHLLAAFGRLPQSAQRQLLTLEEESQAAILSMPHSLLAALLSEVAQPALPAPPETAIVPAAGGPAPVADAGPRLPDGLLDFLLGRVPAGGIDLAALMSVRLPVPMEPLALMGPEAPPSRLHQPSGNDPLLQAGREYLDRGGAEAEVRWALRKTGDDAASAKRVLAFLSAYVDTPLLEQAKLELERANGDQKVAGDKLAALTRMQEEQARRAEASAQEQFDIENEALGQQYETEVAPLLPSKSQQKKQRGAGKPNPKKAALDERYRNLGEGLETTREERKVKGTEANQAVVRGLAAQHDAERLERLMAIAGGDVGLVTALNPALLAAGDGAESLAKALVASGASNMGALARRCQQLLANDEATPRTAVIVAEFMSAVPAPEAQAWARRHGKRIDAVTDEMAFLTTHRKFAAAAVCALDELGIVGAGDIAAVLNLGAPLIWVLQNLAGADRKTALVLIGQRPQEATHIQGVLQLNATAGVKQQADAPLIAEIRKYSGPVYRDAHRHYVTTAAFADSDFETLLDLMAKGRNLAAALKFMDQAEVAVPPGVTVMGWVELNQGGTVRYPMAFRKGGYETDMACIKHYEEMQRPAGTGGIPDVPVARMEHYFADLVAGCDAAFDLYKQEKPAKESFVAYRGRPAGRAEWRIKVKNTGNEPQVFHVDSHYATSYWRTHDN